MKGKKALTASFIVGMMITLIAFFLIAGVTTRFMSKSSDASAENLCQLSIAMRAKSALTVKGDIVDASQAWTPALCKTIDKDVSGNRDKIKLQFAESMARCWWMFGEGRYAEIIGNDGIDGVADMLQMSRIKNNCFNCYTIAVKEDEIKGGPISSSEMEDFMTTNKFSKVDKTYMDYIQSHGGPGRVVFTAPLILPREAYGISMMPVNKDDSDFWSSVAKIGGGILVGTVVAVGVVGATVCTIGTGGLCLGALAAVSAGAGTVAASATAGAIVATQAAGVGGVFLGAGVASYLAIDGYRGMMASLYAERDVSSIYVGFLKVAQDQCGSGDLAGE
jgi:hypothetical protein